jgi:guanylate cyclase
MDYGSLHDLLHNEAMYTGGKIILQIVRDIVQGIQFLHASKPPILHGDLKAKNILVDSRFRAKVADFGFSHIKQRKTIGVQGTPFYMAPEYLRGRQHEYNSACCDIYSMSMIIFEIYGRQEPFEGEYPKQLLPKICHPRLNKRPNIPDSCPPKMADIMKKCWSANPFFRPSARDLDYILVEMTSKDAEPLGNYASSFLKDNMARKPASLYDVFLKHNTDALNAGKQVEPESHEIVTVVFSDIIGFKEISQSFSALKVSNLLDRLYQPSLR